MKLKSSWLAASVAVMALTLGAPAHATSVTIDATDDLYQPVGASSGTPPAQVSVTGGAAYTFSPVTGSITFNGGGNYNDPDGVGNSNATNISALGSFSGIKASNAGYLVGVFVAAGGPAGPAPATLDYTGAGATSALSYAPLIDQVFFIGDGLTGDGSGSQQQFIAPAAAAILYLGFADASYYNGSPGSYEDNSGSFTADVNSNAAATPLPAALPLFATGLAGLGFLARRRKKKCTGA